MTDTGGLLDAILAVQTEAPTLKKDKTNPHFNSKYTPLDTIVETLQPLLAENDLVWITMPAGSHDEPTLRYQLAHVPSGQTLEGEMPLLLDKPSAQAMGSAITYMRRYSLCAVLNLVADDDDDGNAAGTGALSSGKVGPSDAQKKLVEKLVKQKGATAGQLRIILDTLGAVDVEVKEGWLDLLTRGRDGTASQLITFLKENPLPSVEHPSDVPGAEPGEFEHPEEKPMEMLG